jgi:ribosomal protein S18 acetylase RimI-like enzyme
LITIKNVSDCTFKEVQDAWNNGFEGYSLDVTITMERLLQSMVIEGKYPDTSFIAFQNGQPVGLVLNAIREVGGKKIAWNGGTGVSQSHRGQGVGEELIGKSIDLYTSSGVEVAYLESIADNKPAIKLYEKMGYTIFDYLSFLEADTLLGTFQYKDETYHVESTHWSNIKKLPFYQEEVPWQNRFENVQGAEGIIIYKNGNPVSYSLTKQVFNATGEVIAIILYQLGLDESAAGLEDLTLYTLNQIFKPDQLSCKRIVSNFSKSRDKVYSLLIENGFKATVQQVHMKKQIS